MLYQHGHCMHWATSLSALSWHDGGDRVEVGGVRGKGAVNNIRLPPSLSRQRWRQVWVGIATMAQTHKRWKSINLYLYQNHTETLVATPHCGGLNPPNLHLINCPHPPSLGHCSTSDTANNATLLLTVAPQSTENDLTCCCSCWNINQWVFKLPWISIYCK